MKNFLVAFAFLGALLGAITMGDPRQDSNALQVATGLLLPVPDGYCALSADDGEGGSLFKKSRFRAATANVQAITYFAECDQLELWRKERQPIDRFGVYSAVRGEFSAPSITRGEFLSAMAEYLSERKTMKLKDAINRIRGGIGVVELGLIHKDEGAAYSAVLLAGPEGGEAVQVHITAYTKSQDFEYVLHLSAPFENQVTIRDMVAIQKLSIDLILDGH